ncbi:MAG: hypothetical protein HZA93_07260 [Verrucomicrobia bacterium]|nr:hypothetical protein [Verrucomicrobiota bacterium]
MRILAIERDLPAPAHHNLPDLRRAEAAAVWAFTKRGIIRQIWFTTGERRAVIMLECTGADEARHHLDALPLAATGLTDFTLLELTPYDGFERLFGGAVAAAPPPIEAPPEY